MPHLVAAELRCGKCSAMLLASLPRPSLSSPKPSTRRTWGTPSLSVLELFPQYNTSEADITCATPATDLPAALGQGLRSRQAQQVSAYHGHVIRPASGRWQGARMRCNAQCTPWCC